MIGRPDAIDELFVADGPLARAIEGFSERPEQIAMARHVAQALHQRSRLVVEAGTGTGKTFAYLVPALLSGRRVIVSTGTRNLQDQLFHRDLPAVARALGLPVRVALLKGRANYLCLHRLQLAEQQASARGLKREVAMALPRIREWSLITRSGDIIEMTRHAEQDPVWPWVTSTRENCLGPECTDFDRCHVVEARRKAMGADIIVVNHHLLMADLVLKEEGFGDLLPGADAVIVDEAHQLPEIATAFLGCSVSMRQVQSLALDLAAEAMIAPVAHALPATLTQTLERRSFELSDAFGSAIERRDLADCSRDFFEALHELRDCLRDVIHALAVPAEGVAALNAIRRRAQELTSRLEEFDLEPSEGPASVRWVQAHRSGVSLHYVPVDVSTQLGELMDAHTAAWICTSATLAVGEDFSHFLARIGLREAQSARFDSPFDYAQQSLLYLPQGLDAPSSPRHTAQVIEAAAPVLDASGGRAFLLFTSHRALRVAADLLRRRYGTEAPFAILVQGDAPRAALLEEFRRQGNAVLLGTSSFWEGVDVKGPALSVVVIDKLPFAAPDDPVLKARLAAIEQQGGNAFFEEQVPQAAIALKQGVGRLIRDVNDFGVVMLCDQRVQSRGYGRIFLDSLPPLRRTRDLQEVRTFLLDRLAQVDAPLATRRRLP
ncbi:MAG: ATP-dependent DNA helicase [Steroidobacteraceae bacterium]